MKKHLAILLALKKHYLEGDTALPQDAEYGFWSLKKLIAINYLIPQFGRLARTGNFTHCYYLDVLAGSGLVKLENDTTIPGSAIVALAAPTTEPHFEKYFFIERDPSKSDLLKKRLKRVAETTDREYEVMAGDCNAVLPGILNAIYKSDQEHTCFLALFDPEGYSETVWSTVESLLAHGKGDLIFNFTEGIARNVEKARTDPSYLPSLQRYFGESDNDWLQCDGYDRLIDHFSYRLGHVNEIRRTTFRIDVRGEDNRPLYALLIATGSSGYANIVNDLKKRLDVIEVRDLKSTYDQLVGKSRSIDSYGGLL
ncbi:MAG: three-Cys-motif partner protein TcmP [Candidatus Bathyarchaeia archaeon]